ncbi:membrane protein [Gallibacterium genomosp. 3]|uniref:Membrane protein n=1 Tax=Gallibacterium genomosp. 3 TaxID=505345 RepID=A0A1A7PLL2_9PAST|nr:porin [Gallibacterium genomosp. 3]OBX02974.1 membrane protein [Gallibacterium genomosp. 3]
MKKTLVAVAVAALAATSANAAVVYNQDGTKVEVGGQVRLVLSKNKNERSDLKYGDSRLSAQATHELGNGYSALGNIEVRFNDVSNEEEKDGSAYAYNLYAGFAKDDIGTLTFGRQDTNLDDLGISDYTYDLGDVNQTNTHSNKAIKFRSAEWNGFSFGLDYFFGGAVKNSANEQNEKGWGGALFYTAEVANDTTLTLNGGFSKVKTFVRDTNSNTIAADYNKNAFIVGAELASGPFAVAVDYSQSKLTNQVDVDGFNKVRALELGLKYNYLENASVYGEYQYVKSTSYDKSQYEKAHNFILGTDYELTKNVVTYLEAGTFQSKDQDNNKDRDNQIGLGLRVYF